MQIGPVSAAEYEQVLPLIASYQRFYRVGAPDGARNEEFFRRFLGQSEVGLLLGARGGEVVVGFACLYWTFSSVRAEEVVLLNDLFVVEGQRGAGIARRLIDASLEVARRRGAAALQWQTEPSNEVAQRLYDRTGAAQSTWLAYELRVPARQGSAGGQGFEPR